MENKFSIIIPAYNVSEYIAKTIESIKSQTYKKYEIIVIDDCSTDDGATIREIERFSDITLIKNEQNRMPGGARNSGMKVARRRLYYFC